MSWPEGWNRGAGGPRADTDYEPTRVIPDYGGYPGPPPAYEPDDLPPDEVAGRRGRSGGPGRPPRLKYRRPGRWRRRVGLLLVLLLVLLVGGATAGYFYVGSHLTRAPALAAYQGRPAATPGQDWLIVGSDSRAGLSARQRHALRTGNAVGQRTDTIMLLHIGAHGATLVSLPRDSYVEIPARTDSQGRTHSATHNKLNAAYAFGGPQLLARTVENATGIRLDHYMEIGFGGFVGMVDAVGGVNLCLPKAIKDKDAGANLPAGCHNLTGQQALSFVRARHFDPRQDLGRVERQQKFLQALTKKIATPSVLFNPFRLGPVTNASLAAVTVDTTSGPMDLADLFWNMRKLSGGGGVTTTVPVANPDFRAGGGIGSAVLWDRNGAAALFGALRNDSQVSAPTKKR